MSNVLAGVRVIELCAFVTGPAASVLLADLGADVIKVEGRGTSQLARPLAEAAFCDIGFSAYNRTKRSIALDTTQNDDLRIFDQLIGSADVFLQNLPWGAAESLNAGEARLRKLNPKLIYCSITGCGADGPNAKKPYYDTQAQAASGYLDLTLNPINPRILGPAIAETLTGIYTAYGIMGALYERTKSGHGKAVDVSMLDAMMHFNIDAFTRYFTTGHTMHPYTRPGMAQAHVLTCKDGLRIALHISFPAKAWNDLVHATNQPALRNDPRFKTRAKRTLHHTELLRVLAGIFAQLTQSEWRQRLDEFNIPHAPVHNVASALTDPQAQSLQVQTSVQHATKGVFKTIRNPVIYDKTHDQPLSPPPTLDEHRAEILQSLMQV